MTEISLEDGEKVAIWTGLDKWKKSAIGIQFWKYTARGSSLPLSEIVGYQESLIKWLITPEGEREIVNKLEKCHIRQEHWLASIEPDSIIYKLQGDSFESLEFKEVHVSGCAPTRQDALIKAVFEMIRWSS